MDIPCRLERSRVCRPHPHRLPARLHKAEVVHWDELLEIGSWTKAKDLGKIRIEGKEYHPSDGDVMEFRFNV